MALPVLDRLDARRERRWLLAGVVLVLALYVPLNHFTATLPAAAPETWVDRAVPFEPAWVAVYELLYLFLLLPVVLPSGREAFRRIAAAYVVTALVSYAVFLVYPVHFTARPRITSTDTIGAWVLAMTHVIDTPSNCLPSLHVSLALLAGLSAWSLDRAVGALAVPLAIVIGVSTMFVPQHWWRDVVTGWALGGAAWTLLVRAAPRPEGPPERRGALALALAQVALSVAALLLHAAGIGAR